jgi:hypothetical protein
MEYFNAFPTLTYAFLFIRVSERVVPSVTGKSSATTFKASPSPLSAVSLVVVVSSVSLVSSTRKPVVSSRPSLRMYVRFFQQFIQ